MKSEVTRRNCSIKQYQKNSGGRVLSQNILVLGTSVPNDKVSRTLNFIKQNLYLCSKEINKTARFTLVRPCLEYQDER